MRLLEELLDRLGGTSFRLDESRVKRRRMLGILARHGGFLARRMLPYAWRLLRRAGTLRPRYFCIVSHHFMSAAELSTELGRERLAVMGYDLDQLLSELDAAPSTSTSLASDCARLTSALVKEPLRARARRSVGLARPSGLRYVIEA